MAFLVIGKVKNISEDSLDSFPSSSPSVKIQIKGVKGVKAKHCWMLSTNFLSKKFLDSNQQCFAFNPQANFSDHSSLMVKVMGLNLGYLLKSFLLYWMPSVVQTS